MHNYLPRESNLTYLYLVCQPGITIFSLCHSKASSGPKRYDSYDEGVEWVANNQCKYVLALRTISAYATTGKYCNELVQVGEAAFIGGLSFVLPYGSNLTLPMSRATLELIESRKMPTTEKYLRTFGECNFYSTISLSFTKFKVFFMLAFSVCFLLFIEMIFDPQTPRATKSDSAIENSQLGK